MLLTDKEIEENYYYTDGYRGWDLDEALGRVAKAQLRKVARWGTEWCELQNRPRRECGHCWQTIVDEVKG